MEVDRAVHAASVEARVDAAQVEELVVASMEPDRVPGLAVSVVVDGEAAYLGGFGVLHAGHDVPISPNTLFRIGSVTKPLTATLVVRLAQDGVVDLDRPVAELAALRSVPRHVTLRRLLSHSAGLANQAIASQHTARRTVDQHAASAVSGEGAVASYSNPGYALAAQVVARAAAESFEWLLSELVLAPLGMTHTTFDPATARRDGLAEPHELISGKVAAAPELPLDADLAAAGLAFSTVRDLAAFAAVHVTSGGTLLEPSRLADMHTLHARHREDVDAGFGLGFEVYTARNGRATVSHSGTVGGWWAVLAMVPSARTAVVVLANRIPGFRLPSLPFRLLDQVLGLPSPWAGLTWPPTRDGTAPEGFGVADVRRQR